MSKMESRVRSPTFLLAGGFAIGCVHEEEEEGAVVEIGDCATSTGSFARKLISASSAMVLET